MTDDEVREAIALSESLPYGTVGLHRYVAASKAALRRLLAEVFSIVAENAEMRVMIRHYRQRVEMARTSCPYCGENWMGLRLGDERPHTPDCRFVRFAPTGDTP